MGKTLRCKVMKNTILVYLLKPACVRRCTTERNEMLTGGRRRCYGQAVRREKLVGEGKSNMPEKSQILIPATEGAAVVIRRGETIKVIDVEGHQIGDFICFNLHQPREKLSTGETVNFN